MDKTLEIVMVAVALVVAAVVVTSMLQGQSENFGSFADSQTNSSNCDIAANRLATTTNCNDGNDVASDNPVYSQYQGTCWSGTSAAERRAC